jgi:hypothetical protein|tara:strand:- start:7218 stop:7451 length:234 start_codon:yes stop_codon:yes gene_type:complete
MQFVDFPSVSQQTVSTEDTNNAAQSADGWIVPLVIPLDDVDGLLASYDPSNNYSPSAENSRVLARLILDALKKKTEG